MGRSKSDTYKSKGRRRLQEHADRFWDKQKDMAEALGMPPLQLNHYLQGRQVPSLKHAVDIELFTEQKGKKWAIRPREWLEE